MTVTFDDYDEYLDFLSFRHLRRAERILTLPCREGDTVFVLDAEKQDILLRQVMEITCFVGRERPWLLMLSDGRKLGPEDFGKTAFWKKADAEKKLRENADPAAEPHRQIKHVKVVNRKTLDDAYNAGREDTLKEVRAELKKLIEENHLVYVPIAEGSTVYINSWRGPAKAHKVTVVGSAYVYTRNCQPGERGEDFFLKDIGVNVFLTEKEAREAWKKQHPFDKR